ncbi:aldo/keto reductase [Frankia sp. EAN1pec]|uniref:aldo/keto reductase n=1 Tax=Parafrankia sp. (strain EAN1pec) TaxID=298653 RepID=UPI0007C52966
MCSTELLQGQRIGFGTAGLSVAVPAPRDVARSVVHAALDAGVRLLDTAASYIPDHQAVGHNEKVIADALSAWTGDRSSVIVSTKGGMIRATTIDYSTDLATCGCRRCIISDCDTSLRALDVDQVALYQLHAPDPRTPIEESVRTMAELQQAGKIREIGLSNIGLDDLTRAESVTRIASVQNRLNPADLASLAVLRACEKSGILFLAYSPLGGLGGAARRLAARSEAFAGVAGAKGTSTQSVILAWERALSPVLVPVVGARRPETIRDSASFSTMRLTDEEVALLDAAVGLPGLDSPAENLG